MGARGNQKLEMGPIGHGPLSGDMEYPAGAREIMTTMLDVLIEAHAPDKLLTQIDVPDELLESFGECCKQAELIDQSGKFHDPYKLVQFFCQ